MNFRNFGKKQIFSNLPSSQMTSRSSASISNVSLSMVMVVCLSKSTGTTGAGSGVVHIGIFGSLGPLNLGGIFTMNLQAMSHS